MGWFDKKGETPVEESTESKGSGVWGSQLNQALSDAYKGRVGSEKGSKSKSDSGKESGSGRSIPEAIREKLAKLFQVDSWRPIVKAPFALMQAWTGRACWQLDKKEEDSLATTTSTAMEYIAITDPKVLAIGMCAVTWAIVFSEKVILNAKERAKEEALKPQEEIITPGVNLVR